jgi:hypothetical protein
LALFSFLWIVLCPILCFYVKSLCALITWSWSILMWFNRLYYGGDWRLELWMEWLLCCIH